MEEPKNSPPQPSGISLLFTVVFTVIAGWGALYLGASVINAMTTGEICGIRRLGCVSWKDDYWDMWWAFSERAFGAFIFGSMALAGAFTAWQYLKAD